MKVLLARREDRRIPIQLRKCRRLVEALRGKKVSSTMARYSRSRRKRKPERAWSSSQIARLMAGLVDRRVCRTICLSLEPSVIPIALPPCNPKPWIASGSRLICLIWACCIPAADSLLARSIPRRDKEAAAGDNDRISAMDVRPALVPGARSRIQERSAYRGKPSGRQSLGRPSSEAARGSVLHGCARPSRSGSIRLSGRAPNRS